MGELSSEVYTRSGSFSVEEAVVKSRSKIELKLRSLSSSPGTVSKRKDSKSLTVYFMMRLRALTRVSTLSMVCCRERMADGGLHH